MFALLEPSPVPQVGGLQSWKWNPGEGPEQGTGVFKLRMHPLWALPAPPGLAPDRRHPALRPPQLGGWEWGSP